MCCPRFSKEVLNKNWNDLLNEAALTELPRNLSGLTEKQKVQLGWIESAIRYGADSYSELLGDLSITDAEARVLLPMVRF